jgi:hypothetical protein
MVSQKPIMIRVLMLLDRRAFEGGHNIFDVEQVVIVFYTEKQQQVVRIKPDRLLFFRDQHQLYRFCETAGLSDVLDTGGKPPSLFDHPLAIGVITVGSSWLIFLFLAVRGYRTLDMLSVLLLFVMGSQIYNIAMQAPDTVDVLSLAAVLVELAAIYYLLGARSRKPLMQH